MSDDENWPPPPRIPLSNPRDRVVVPVLPAPDEAFKFVLKHCVGYGIVAGMLYGAVVGELSCCLWIHIIGAVFGFMIGAVCGLAAGLVDGLILGGYAYYSCRRGVGSNIMARTIRILAPVITCAVAFPVYMSIVTEMFLMQHEALIACAIVAVAAFAGWDASRRMMNKFHRQYG